MPVRLGARSARTGLGGRTSSRGAGSERARALRIAPIRRRFLAGLINVLIAVLAVALALAGSLGVAQLTGRNPKHARGIPFQKIAESSRAKLALKLCGFVLGVLTTGRQGPGSRIAGIRMVDLGTGGRVSIPQAALREGVRWAWKGATKRATARFRVRNRPQLDDPKEEIQALKRQHADDQAARQRAIMALYEERKARPYAACLPALVPALLAALVDAPMLWSPRNQGLADIIAGTVVIVDR